MCLAIPAKVLEIDENRQARVDIVGNTHEANLLLVPEAEVGDYVLLHAGFAIAKVEEDEAMETLSILEQIANSEVS
jgi:hydrogenase expression/formation protein HypC